MTETVEVTIHRSFQEIAAADWDAVACPETADGGRPIDPFTNPPNVAAMSSPQFLGARGSALASLQGRLAMVGLSP